MATNGPHCVLWHTGPLPPELSASLSRKGLTVSAFTSPYAALAEVCCRGGARGRATPPSGRGGVILLVVEPRRLIGAAEMVRAAGKYAPRAAVWMYESGANPRLRAVVEEDVDAWECVSDNAVTKAQVVVLPRPSSPPARAEAGTSGTPRLRLAHDVDEERASGEPRPPAAPLLSPEELEMLLADGPQGAGDRGRS